MNNADVVKEFSGRKRFEVGDEFVLPDVDQVYEVTAVRPFTKNGKLMLYLDLAAICAVHGCDEMLEIAIDVYPWRRALYLTRTCPEHRGRFRSPVRDAWSGSHRVSPLKGKARGPHKPHVGRIQRRVLEAYWAWELIVEVPTREQVVETVVQEMEPPSVGRDTRRFRAERAYDLLEKNDMLSCAVDA